MKIIVLSSKMNLMNDNLSDAIIDNNNDLGSYLNNNKFI